MFIMFVCVLLCAWYVLVSYVMRYAHYFQVHFTFDDYTYDFEYNNMTLRYIRAYTYTRIYVYTSKTKVYTLGQQHDTKAYPCIHVFMYIRLRIPMFVGIHISWSTPTWYSGHAAESTVLFRSITQYT